MGMNKGWISPAVPFGSIGLQEYALCFWSTHATVFSWMFRFIVSVLGYGAGYWIGTNTDGATLSQVLASSEQLPNVVRTLARFHPNDVCGVFGAFIGALSAEVVLWRGSYWSPLGEGSFCLSVVYVVFLPWFRVPIFLYPHPTACEALVPPVTT